MAFVLSAPKVYTPGASAVQVEQKPLDSNMLKLVKAAGKILAGGATHATLGEKISAADLAPYRSAMIAALISGGAPNTVNLYLTPKGGHLIASTIKRTRRSKKSKTNTNNNPQATTA